EHRRGIGEQRCNQIGDEVRLEVRDVGVDPADEVTAQDRQASPERLPFAFDGGDGRQQRARVHHRGSGLARDGRSAVRRAAVEDDELIDKIGHQRVGDGAADAADGRRFVDGGEGDADRHALRAPFQAQRGCARSRTLFFMDTITWSRLERLVARVAGDDPAAFLDATTTQDLTGLTAGRSVLTCMLDEKGHVQAELRATMLDDGTVLIDAEQAAREALTGWLAKIAPLSGCEVSDESDLWTVTALFGVHEAPA